MCKPAQPPEKDAIARQGRTVDFRNTVIVMTSNLGSDLIQEMTIADKPQADIRNEVMSVVGHHFRPEFINRIDETVIFDPLSQQQVRGIANIQLALLQQRLQDKDLAIELDEAVLDKLSEAGFDPVYGARPLRRTLQQLLENPLSQKLLAGDFMPGDTIKTSLDDLGHLVFTK
ncbi:MAG: AAA family ATPase [Pseudomonadota bacterium]